MPPVPFKHVAVAVGGQLSYNVQPGHRMCLCPNPYTPADPITFYIGNTNYALDSGATIHNQGGATGHVDTVTGIDTAKNVGDLDPRSMGGASDRGGLCQYVGGNFSAHISVPYLGKATTAASTGHTRIFGVPAGVNDATDANTQGSNMLGAGNVKYTVPTNVQEFAELPVDTLQGSRSEVTYHVPIQHTQPWYWYKTGGQAYGDPRAGDEPLTGSLKECLEMGCPVLYVDNPSGAEVVTVVVQWDLHYYTSVKNSSPVASLGQMHDKEVRDVATMALQPVSKRAGPAATRNRDHGIQPHTKASELDDRVMSTPKPLLDRARNAVDKAQDGMMIARDAAKAAYDGGSFLYSLGKAASAAYSRIAGAERAIGSIAGPIVPIVEEVAPAAIML